MRINLNLNELLDTLFNFVAGQLRDKKNKAKRENAITVAHSTIGAASKRKFETFKSTHIQKIGPIDDHELQDILRAAGLEPSTADLTGFWRRKIEQTVENANSENSSDEVRENFSETHISINNELTPPSETPKKRRSPIYLYALLSIVIIITSSFILCKYPECNYSSLQDTYDSSISPEKTRIEGLIMIMATGRDDTRQRNLQKLLDLSRKSTKDYLLVQNVLLYFGLKNGLDAASAEGRVNIFFAIYTILSENTSYNCQRTAILDFVSRLDESRYGDQSGGYITKIKELDGFKFCWCGFYIKLHSE